jgi:hypothetical protein
MKPLLDFFSSAKLFLALLLGLSLITIGGTIWPVEQHTIQRLELYCQPLGFTCRLDHFEPQYYPISLRFAPHDSQSRQQQREFTAREGETVAIYQTAYSRDEPGFWACNFQLSKDPCELVV